MKRNLSRVLLLILLVAAAAAAAETIDRIVAGVNGRVILQSDWDDAVCYEAFAEGRPLSEVTLAVRKAALDRLIDQELLREQMRSAEYHAAPEEVEKKVQDIRQHHKGTETEEGWRTVLASYGLTQKDLEGRVALQLEVMRLVDARLRPTIQIDSHSIESYYQQTLIPQLRQAGAKEVPLAEVTPKIKELLTQQKMNQLLVAWLQNLRAESQIHTASPDFPDPGRDAGESQKR